MKGIKVDRKNVIYIDTLFIEIFNKYSDDVYRLAYSYTLKSQDAEDISQKTFLKLYNNMSKFNSANEDVKRWLFRVAINDAKNILSSSWKKKNILTDELEIISEKTTLDNSRDLIESLNNIHKKYRIPLYLYYYEGYSIKEISSIMKTNESTIKSRLTRGRDKLKDELEEKTNVK